MVCVFCPLSADADGNGPFNRLRIPDCDFQADPVIPWCKPVRIQRQRSLQDKVKGRINAPSCAMGLLQRRASLIGDGAEIAESPPARNHADEGFKPLPIGAALAEVGPYETIDRGMSTVTVQVLNLCH